MYVQLRQSMPGLTAWRSVQWPSISRNVINLGLTSLFTDISSESVSTILPLYLFIALKFTPLQFGVLDGLYQGGAAFIRLFGASAADRTHRYKEVAAVGYALSAVSKIGLQLGAAGGPGLIAAALFVDRTGKGIRTAPRDALISLSTQPRHLGVAFGVHRALDTCGAVLGPLMAFAILALVPNGFDVVFVCSLCAAIIGLGFLLLFVENRPRTTLADAQAAPLPLRQLARLPGFKPLLFAAAGLSVATVSDAFLYLNLQQKLSFAATFIPLLYVGTSAVYFLLALPAGRLADRVGRGRVFGSGYVLLILVYALLLIPDTTSVTTLVMSIAALGCFYAATDGVLMAFASALLPEEVRAGGLALLTATTGLGSLAASVLFGALWAAIGPGAAVTAFLVALCVAVLLALPIFWQPGGRTHEQAAT